MTNIGSAPQAPAMVTSGDAGQNVEADGAGALCDERLAGDSNPARADPPKGFGELSGGLVEYIAEQERKAAAYPKLVAALEEALNGWAQWYVNYPDPIEHKKIEELRKLLA